MNVLVTVYSLWYCDDFGWAKTRAVAADDVEGQQQEKEMDKQTGKVPLF